MRIRTRTEALLIFLIAFLMIMGTFGSQIFIQETKAAESVTMPVSDEVMTTVSFHDETRTQEDLSASKTTNSLSFADKNGLDEPGTQTLFAPALKTGAVEDRNGVKSKLSDKAYDPAGGPLSSSVEFTEDEYGNESSPYWVGDTISFAVDHDPSLVYFRYDLDEDNDWEVPERPADVDPLDPSNWVTMDIVSWTYADEFIGQAYVEAWDGVSMTIATTGGKALDEPSPYWFIHYSGYMPVWSFGMQFEALEDCKVLELGRYKDYYQMYAYEVMFWEDDGDYLGYSSPGNTDGWQWGAFYPAYPGAEHLQKGEKYRAVFVARLRYVNSSFSGYHRGTAGMPSGDEVIKPLAAAFGQDWSFPSDLTSTDFVGLVDVHWVCSHDAPLADSDTANVWVEEKPPNSFDIFITPQPAHEGQDITLERSWFNAHGSGGTFECMIHRGDGVSVDRAASTLETSMHVLNNLPNWIEKMYDVVQSINHL